MRQAGTEDARWVVQHEARWGRANPSRVELCRSEFVRLRCRKRGAAPYVQNFAEANHYSTLSVGLGGVLPRLRTSPPSRIKLLSEKAYKNLRSESGNTMGSDSWQGAERGSGEGAGGGLLSQPPVPPDSMRVGADSARRLSLQRNTARQKPR